MHGCHVRAPAERRKSARAAALHRNKTLGVVGYGDIGQKCAHIARAFGMRIVAMRRRTELSESERDSGLKARLARDAKGGLDVAEKSLGWHACHTHAVPVLSFPGCLRARSMGAWVLKFLFRVLQRFTIIKVSNRVCRMHASQCAASMARALVDRDARVRCAVPLQQYDETRSVLCGYTTCDRDGAARCSRPIS